MREDDRRRVLVNDTLAVDPLNRPRALWMASEARELRNAGGCPAPSDPA